MMSAGNFHLNHLSSQNNEKKKPRFKFVQFFFALRSFRTQIPPNIIIFIFCYNLKYLITAKITKIVAYIVTF
jgi:hypothetical protein